MQVHGIVCSCFLWFERVDLFIYFFRFFKLNVALMYGFKSALNHKPGLPSFSRQTLLQELWLFPLSRSSDPSQHRLAITFIASSF